LSRWRWNSRATFFTGSNWLRMAPAYQRPNKLRPGAETTCVPQKGEHPFLTEAQWSYVRYQSAREAKAADLAKLIKTGTLKVHQPASPTLVAKVRAGAQASTFLAANRKALL
jgi:hypothetical protein